MVLASQLNQGDLFFIYPTEIDGMQFKDNTSDYDVMIEKIRKIFWYNDIRKVKKNLKNIYTIIDENDEPIPYDSVGILIAKDQKGYNRMSQYTKHIHLMSELYEYTGISLSNWPEYKYYSFVAPI